ncbi:hypothetical protein ILYODFUR_038918 [Ilyodon furcidens]|uniref:Uncharacterized protein n=1 Tax=Ilyodon furcidens TaxID=33524 RepID=A0ABV0T3W4_9TELE
MTPVCVVVRSEQLKARDQKAAVQGVVTQPGFSKAEGGRSMEVQVFTGKEKQFVHLVGQGTHICQVE